jgi:hypothetical protein
MTYQVHLTTKSKNEKTGPIPVSTTEAQTCPDICPFNNANEGGCYAESGPLKMHWMKVSDRQRGDTWPVFIGKITNLKADTLWRHNQAGDLAGNGHKLDATANMQLAQANESKRGFTYTHYDVLSNKHNRMVVTQMNKMGFTVNLSANNLSHADELVDLDAGPVVTVLPIDQIANTTTPQGRKVVVCPAAIRDDVSCATCQLCQRQRDFIIGFPAHGTSKKKANAIANG